MADEVSTPASAGRADVPSIASRSLGGGRADSLGLRAYNAIREAIRTGGLVCNQRYSENELAASMGISRTPVREALIELAREGLVEIAPQRGFQLRVLSVDEQNEIFDLRATLEEFAAQRLAEFATDADVAELRAILLRQREVFDDPMEFLALDEEFHLAMPRITGLSRTRDMLFTLRGAMWLMGVRALAVPTRARTAHKEHLVIVSAVAKGDEKAAAAAARKHVESTRAAVHRIAHQSSST